MLYTAVLIFQLIIAGLLFFLLISFITGGPFVPSTHSASQAMIDVAKLQPGMQVVDLGSGDGRILRLAARAGAHATGYELNPYLVIWSRFLNWKSGLSRRTTVRWQNLWSADLVGADVVFIYLLPFGLDKLTRTLDLQLRSGSIVVTNSFLLPRKKPFRSDTKHHVYAYKMPK